MVMLPSQKVVPSFVRAFSFGRPLELTPHSNQEYIINKHGNGRVAPPKEGELIDLYCDIRSL